MNNPSPDARPCDLVIFGGAGDLARRKLLPSLYYLRLDGYLSEDTRIIGCARTAHTDAAYRKLIHENLKNFVPAKDFRKDLWESFSGQLGWVSVNATQLEDFETLSKRLGDRNGRDLVIYLSTSPSLYEAVCLNLHKVGLAQDSTRVVLEKPIGTDLASSKVINDGVAKVFPERNVYRIDHYLGKETVQNLLALRFGNALFEPMWSNQLIDHVQITVGETVGVEGRWSYYDDSGALRDMVQNHLLQVLCLLAMEPPSKMDTDAVRDEKIKVLRALRPIGRFQVRKRSVRGQYGAGIADGKAVVGYLDEEGGNPESNTETFVALRADIDNWRWAGVPFYLRTGKRLPARYSEVVVQFKQVPHSIFAEESGSLVNNQMTLRLQPDEGVSLLMNAKAPGLGRGMSLKPVRLNFTANAAGAGMRIPEAYERLLWDVICANSTLFVRRDEVEAAWTWVDNILDGWKQSGMRPDSYPSGTWGPTSSVALMVRDGRMWRE